MGIQVEFNPDLALRSIEEFRNGVRKVEECIPNVLEIGREYEFKKGQRFYWLHGELPLLQTEGEGRLSLPIASVIIKEVRHLLVGDEVWTRGVYEVREVFNGNRPRFNGFAKIK